MERDEFYPQDIPPFCSFQSTRSAWSVTTSQRIPPHYQRISIHTLRMERDACFPKFTIARTLFQSTRSAWSVTVVICRARDHLLISIHTLRMERDFTARIRFTFSAYFNPHAPHGA